MTAALFSHYKLAQWFMCFTPDRSSSVFMCSCSWLMPSSEDRRESQAGTAEFVLSALGCREKAIRLLRPELDCWISNNGAAAPDGLGCETAEDGVYPSAVEQPKFNRVSATACGGKRSLQL